jgi:hypothetical protein
MHAELASEQDPAKALEILSGLTSDSRMQRVWQELYKKKRVEHQTTDEFLYPARVTDASHAIELRQRARELREKDKALNERKAKLLDAEATILESLDDPPWIGRLSEQDRGAQLFLYHTYRIALDLKPVFLSDLKANVDKLRTIAKRLQEDAKTLRLLGIERNAQKLDEIASDSVEKAKKIDPDLRSPGDDTWIITRKRGDTKLRAFIIDLSIISEMLFRKSLYSSLATVTNVVFSRDDVKPAKVREMLRVSADPGI